jgi:hypothetical protein
MFDDEYCGAKGSYLRPGWSDARKTMKVGQVLRVQGILLLLRFLEDHFSFITKAEYLEAYTFEELFEKVNGPKLCAHTAGALTRRVPRFESSPGPAKDKVEVNPIVLEWINDHANPLVCLDELYNEGRRIMMQKNHDYTGGSGDPYANFRGSESLDISPITGILLRVQDKLMRIKTFDEKGELLVQNEGIKDAMIDVINYMALIYGLVKEQSRESE